MVYTEPEVASIGATKDTLKEANVKYKVGKFAFIAQSRARTSGETDVVVKVLADADRNILGAHVCGARGGDLNVGYVITMIRNTRVEEVARTCHARPAMGQAVKEACLDRPGRAIHA